MALSKRLLSIFSMVEKGSVVADIGCDHGLLSIALIQGGIAQHIYACDLRKGPLSRAKEAIHACGYEQQITTLLSDGLTHVPMDVDTIVIAGMGHETILKILENRMELVQQAKRIIVQANKHVDEIRRWISEHHFTILEEDIVEEDHFYEIVCFQCVAHASYSEDEITFGIHHQLPLFMPYMTYRLQKIEELLQQIPQQAAMYAVYQELHKRIQNIIAEKSHPSIR